MNNEIEAIRLTLLHIKRFGYNGEQYDFEHVVPADLINILENDINFNGGVEWLWSTILFDCFDCTILITGNVQFIAHFNLWDGSMSFQKYE